MLMFNKMNKEEKLAQQVQKILFQEKEKYYNYM